jgi:hypothetical protein
MVGNYFKLLHLVRPKVYVYGELNVTNLIPPVNHPMTLRDVTKAA